MGSKNSARTRLREFSSVGGSPGRCFLNTSISASSSRLEGSFSSVMRMNGLSSNSASRPSSDLSMWKPVFSSVSGSARRSVVTGSLRLRSMRTLTMPFLSISISSHEPRDGIRLATNTCLVASFGSMM